MATYIQRSTPVGLNNDAQYASFPAACKRHAGDYLVVYRSNVTTHELTDGGDIVAQTTGNQGSSWAAATTIQTAPSGRDYRDPGLIRLADSNKLLLTYTSTLATGHSSSNLLRTVRSDDDGATWNTPIDITYSGQGDNYAVTACSPVQLANGRILLAVYITDSGRTNTNSYVYYSDDNAATWSFLSMCGNGNGDGRDYVEPSLALLPNGNILCLLRQYPNGETWYCTSSNSGSTWTTPAKAFNSSAAPRVTVHDDKIYVFGRSTASPFDYCWIFWTTQDRLASGQWRGPWQWRQTSAGFILNYGHFISDGSQLWAVWCEGQSLTDSDLYWSKIVDSVSDGDTLIGDSFDRANSTTIGYADGGAAGVVAAGKGWTPYASGSPRIQTNKLENNNATAGANAYVYMASTGIDDFDFSCKLTATTSYSSLRFRLDNTFDPATESGYQIALIPATSAYTLQRVDSGTSTVLQTSNQGITANTEYTVRVRAVGSEFKCYLNGVLIFTQVDATHAGADHTWFQIQLDNIAGNTAKADDFAIAAAIDGSALPLFAHHYRQLALR